MLELQELKYKVKDGEGTHGAWNRYSKFGDEERPTGESEQILKEDQ